MAAPSGMDIPQFTPANRANPSAGQLHSAGRSLRTQYPTPAVAPNAAVAIRYLDRKPIRVQGGVSGRFYQFSASEPVQSVDVRDAASLLNSRLFRRC